MKYLILLLLTVPMLTGCGLNSYRENYQAYAEQVAKANEHYGESQKKVAEARATQITSITQAASGCELDSCREHVATLAAIAAIVSNNAEGQSQRPALPQPPQQERNQWLDVAASVLTQGLYQARSAYSDHTALQGRRSDNGALVGVVSAQGDTAVALGGVLAAPLSHGIDALAGVAAQPHTTIGGDQIVVGGDYDTGTHVGGDIVGGNRGDNVGGDDVSGQYISGNYDTGTHVGGDIVGGDRGDNIGRDDVSGQYIRNNGRLLTDDDVHTEVAPTPPAPVDPQPQPDPGFTVPPGPLPQSSGN